ncbi:MAG: hypothetical protein KA313_01615 [Pseudarcicella sp.]|jgi:hypothetical protein|nr:hypothetical protein [Pseudarcicella sp.]MBP6409774.1 hypothetical protein [Pseudarcicella sp.]
MKKLSLEELKAKSAQNIITQLDAINGGETVACHKVGTTTGGTLLAAPTMNTR